MTNKKYSVDYFIDKFEAIPEELWTTDTYIQEEKHCALGHCGARNGVNTLESSTLSDIFDVTGDSISGINDGYDARYQQDTPKQRVLAALRDKKKEYEKL